MTGRGRVLVVGALVAAVVLAVLGWTRTPAGVQAARVRDDVAAAAEAFTTGMMTYDHADLDRLRDRVRGGATADFADSFTATLDGDLGAEIVDTEATSRVAVSRVLVDVDGDDRAHAVVVLDSEITSTTGTRELVDLYIELAMVRQDGRWLVADLTRLAAREAGGGGDGSRGDG